MKPNLLAFPHVSSYPVLLLLGIFAGWWLARKLARKKSLDPRHIDNIALLVPLLGLAGARFFARLFYAKVGFWEALQIWKGDGLVFYGGFLCCIIGIGTYCFLKKLSLPLLLDVLAPSAAVGLAFGRVGCFLAGCCWGDFCVDPAKLATLPPARFEQVRTIPSFSSPGFPLAMQFPEKSDVFKTQVKWGLLQPDARASLPVHPVQLYEAAMALLLAAFLWMASKRAVPPGLLAIALLSSYATIRFLTEFLRGDNAIGENGLTISQTISIYIAMGALALLFWRRLTSVPQPFSNRPSLGQVGSLPRA